MGFQNSVQTQQAAAVAGDFASANPRAAFVSPEGQYVANALGVTVAAFAWIQADGTVKSTAASGVPDGFIHREQQALISTYLAESGNVIPGGFPVTVMKSGDYYFKATVGAAVKGQKAFAKLTDGSIQTAAAGASVAGYVETPFTVAVGCLVNELGIMSL